MAGAFDPVVVYTDGACLGNPGPGGWAWAVPGGAFAAGHAAHTTNQRMEITAAHEAVLRAGAGERPVEVVSDSTYVVNCFRDRWWEGWIKRGWLNSARKPVANRDLWEPFVELVRERGGVTFRWVKGHSGDPMNDLVDRLAVEAAQTQADRAGTEPPAVVGEPDRPALRSGDRAGPSPVGGAGSAGGAALEGAGPAAGGGAASYRDGVPGHALVVFGHRPTELGGYGDNAVADAVRSRIREVVAAKREMEPDLVVVSGLRLGAEQLGAEAAVDLDVPLVAVLPYPDPDSVWPADARAHFARLVAAARDVLTLERRSPDSKQKAGAALRRRDAWLARHADEALVVWDGEDPALSRLVRSLEDHLGDDVWLIDPGELA